MKKNVGKKDAMIRYGIAAGALIGAILLPEYRTLLLIASAALALTAYVGLCGLYKILGINTCPLDQQ
ncbi:MAG: DUF2892 domain-containing protein [Erysipelothrix sp.]|nr:DUF2892 domain-containing protein [Erysipelothrix sp.]